VCVGSFGKPKRPDFEGLINGLGQNGYGYYICMWHFPEALGVKELDFKELDFKELSVLGYLTGVLGCLLGVLGSIGRSRLSIERVPICNGVLI
jgi:hypothetical protein